MFETPPACAACGGPLPASSPTGRAGRNDRRTCSGRCRSRLHYAARGAADRMLAAELLRAARSGNLRRLAEAAAKAERLAS